MKKAILFVMSAILGISATALADVKIKSKQTVSGQTSENTTYIKGKRQRTEMMGGVMISITQCDLERDLQLNPQTKTYMVTNYNENSTPDSAPQPAKSVEATKGGTMYVTTTIKDTGERRQMFGFTARHLVQTIEMESSPDSCNPTKSKMELDSWVIDVEFGLQCTETRKYLPNYNTKSGGCRDKVVPKTIGSAKSGYPLYQKMTSTDPNGKEFSMVQEVVEFSKATLEASLFDAPADYREVKDSAALYATASSTNSGLSYTGPSSAPTIPIPGVTTSASGNSSGIASNIKSATAQPREDSAPAQSAKKAGTVRIGVSVKTAAVGEGITAQDLSLAIQNTLGQYLKGTKVEAVPLEAKLASAQAEEAKQKECDYVLTATASHKKGGGGGFGFGKMLAQTVAQTGIGHTGSTVGNLAGQMATTAIVTASNLSGNVKAKDELTLDLLLQSPGTSNSVLTKQFKAKAQANGDDIISTVVEQAAQAIIEAVGK